MMTVSFAEVVGLNLWVRGDERRALLRPQRLDQPASPNSVARQESRATEKAGLGPRDGERGYAYGPSSAPASRRIFSIRRPYSTYIAYLASASDWPAFLSWKTAPRCGSMEMPPS